MVFVEMIDRTIGGLQQVRRLFGVAQSPNSRDAYLYTRTESGEESPFEAALRYTTQKLILSIELAKRINKINGGRDLDILDIGSSKGTLLALISRELFKLEHNHAIRFSLLEPDHQSVEALKLYAEAIDVMSRSKFTSTVVEAGWEEYESKEQDVVMANHVIYHLVQSPQIYLKMIKAIRPGGHLFVVAREKEGNEVYNLLQRYKNMVPGEKFNEITIQDALPHLQSIVNGDVSLAMKIDRLRPTVVFPFESDITAAKKIIAFFLQCPAWEALPGNIQKAVLNEYGGKDTLLNQIDTVVEITKAQVMQ